MADSSSSVALMKVLVALSMSSLNRFNSGTQFTDPSLYPIPGICHEYKSWQGFYDLRYGGSIVLDFFACISSIIAAYRFSVSWILRLRAFAFLLQFAVTVLYILASSVKTETSLSTYFSSS